MRAEADKGWFGPRGLATIVFAVLVLDEKLPGNDTIILTAGWTVLSPGLFMPYIVDHAGGTLISPFDRALRVDLGVDPDRELVT
jgi:hypothetical protein